MPFQPSGGPAALTTDIIDVSGPPYLAKLDVKSLFDVTMTSGSATVSSASAAFTQADVGKLVQVAGAGTNATFTGTDSNVTTPTYITGVSSTASVRPGQLITGLGVPAGTFVVAVIVVNSIIEISQAATSANAGATFTVSNPVNGTISAVGSATSATVSANAGTSVTNATLTYGTDDSAAFTAAVAAFNAAGRADLYVPHGDSFVGGGYVLTGSGSVRGAGAGATGFSTTLILKPGAGANVDMLTVGKLVTVRNIGLDGNYLNQGGTGTGRLIVVTDAYVRLDSLFLNGACGNGIDFSTASSVGGHLVNVDVRTCQGYGLNIAASAFDNDFTSLNIGRSGKSGVNILAADSAFNLLHSWGNGTIGTNNDQSGVVLRSGVSACRFAIPYLENNYDRGLYIPNSGSAGHSINGGFIWKNRAQGVYAFGALKMSINGATIFDNGQAGVAGHSSAGIENDSGSYWVVGVNTFFDDQGTKTQTFGYFESNTADRNCITGNSMPAALLKTGSNTIVGVNNIPSAANMGTLNIVV